MNSGKKVVAIGGGTGLSTMLKGLKLYTHEITAIVTVADDGGSSGMLRSDFGMLPPGDVRNCVSALANVDPLMGELLNFRFKEGNLKGHSLGNLILAALNEMSDSFEEAVCKFNKVMSVAGTVYPVTNDSVILNARLKNGEVIEGESHIGIHREGRERAIESVFLNPNKVSAIPDAIEAIDDAEIIVLGPGSLYTSIIPNLLVDGIVDAIKRSDALKIYVCNIMTQGGETEGYSASDHLEALERHSYKGIADIMIVNNAPVPEGLKIKYAEEFAEVVLIDTKRVMDRCAVVQGNLMLIRNEKIRHNFSRLARTIIQLGRNAGSF